MQALNLTGTPKSKAKVWEGNDPRLVATSEFIERNRLTLSRPQEEIVARMKSDGDFFGFGREVLVSHLTAASAAAFLDGEAPAEWQPPPGLEETAQDFLDYMVFAWMKAQDERGISASRSVTKLGEWLWLMGRDDLHALIHRDDLYPPYGAPALIAVCEAMGVPAPDSLRAFARECKG